MLHEPRMMCPLGLRASLSSLRYSGLASYHGGAEGGNLTAASPFKIALAHVCFSSPGVGGGVFLRPALSRSLLAIILHAELTSAFCPVIRSRYLALACS